MLPAGMSSAAAREPSANNVVFDGHIIYADCIGPWGSEAALLFVPDSLNDTYTYM